MSVYALTILCCHNCNTFNNQHWNWCLLCLFSLVLKKNVTHVKFGTRTETTI